MDGASDVNAEYFMPHLVFERQGKARSFFHSFVLNILEHFFFLLSFFFEQRQFVLMQFRCFPLVPSFTMWWLSVKTELNCNVTNAFLLLSLVRIYFSLDFKTNVYVKPKSRYCIAKRRSCRQNIYLNTDNFSFHVKKKRIEKVNFFSFLEVFYKHSAYLYCIGKESFVPLL